jgi:hypothetical protein
MKETNLTENQLRSWQPRRPSAGLEQQIFSRARTGMSFRIEITWAFRLLAPAAACLLVAVSVLHQNSNLAREQYGSGPMTDMPASNVLALLTVDYHQPHNDFSALTFEWTKRSSSTSSIGPFSPGKVN